MSNATEQSETLVHIRKINELVAADREDLIAAIIADYERGADTEIVGSQTDS